MTLLILSFIGGVLTVLAPCILPLLPVIVGGSLGSSEISRKRAIVVTASLGVSVVAFTFILKVSTLFVTVPQYFWTYLSGGIILLFGVVTLFPKLWENLSFLGTLNVKSNEVLAKGYKRASFWGDAVVGASLGPIFSSCSPTYFLVLATVLPQKPLLGFIYLLTYALGLCLTLLLVALVGQKLADRLGIVADPNGWFKRALGVLFILIGLAIIIGFDKVVETEILNRGFFDVTKIEQVLLKL